MALLGECGRDREDNKESHEFHSIASSRINYNILSSDNLYKNIKREFKSHSIQFRGWGWG